MLGQFLARAVADHVLPMTFLERYKGKVDCVHGRYANSHLTIDTTTSLTAQLTSFLLIRLICLCCCGMLKDSYYTTRRERAFVRLSTFMCVPNVLIFNVVVVCLSRVALDRAAVLLSMKREMVRLDNVWGVGGGLRPVKHLVKEVSSPEAPPPPVS